ncbi:MAG: PilN domain-containing protein [Gammaproteobacteria bacterium]
MPRINLLPWRDELRAQRRNQFYMAMGGAFGMAALATLIGVLIMNGVIDAQQDRNRLVQAEIVKLDERIKEILDLEEKKDSLVARMKIIEQLQQSRPEVVHLFEEVVRVLPDGVHLSYLKQTGTRLEIKGRAESNTRVSALMRNIDKSPWLEKPDLRVVEVKGGNRSSRLSEFTVYAKQVRMQKEEG